MSLTLPADQNIVVLSIAATKPTFVDLGNYYNNFGITTAPWQVPNHQGFDLDGNYYNSSNLDLNWLKGKDSVPDPVYMTWAGAAFKTGPIPTENKDVSNFSSGDYHLNVVKADGQTISVPSGEYTNVRMLGAGEYGTQSNQQIRVNFTDGTSEIWTQTFTDWATKPDAKTADGEFLVNAGTRIDQLGNQTETTANVYGYSYPVPAGKTVQSLTLPNNNRVGILAISLL